MTNIRIENQFGREVNVTEEAFERNKDRWKSIDGHRDEHNNIDTTADSREKEAIDLPDVEEELSKMSMKEARAKCKELGLKQPFGASKDELIQLIIYAS